MLDLNNKTAIVSGGSKGIGKAIATKLAQAGANVVICSRKKENLEFAVNEAVSNGLTLIPIECNTSDKESIQSVVDHTLEKFNGCLLYTSPSPRDPKTSRMPSSA